MCLEDLITGMIFHNVIPKEFFCQIKNCKINFQNLLMKLKNKIVK
jgi:hypothetical protein